MSWKDCNAVEADPLRTSGSWVFVGTRIPVCALFENLEAGATIDEIVEWFPGVARDEVVAVLRHVALTLSQSHCVHDSAR